jgi:hypothetical protein
MVKDRQSAIWSGTRRIWRRAKAQAAVKRIAGFGGFEHELLDARAPLFAGERGPQQRFPMATMSNPSPRYAKRAESQTTGSRCAA